MSVEALESLIGHPGWQIFAAHVGEDWGPKAYARRLKAAVSHARQHGTDAAAAIEQVDAANEAIAEAMRWPSEELARLKRAQERPEPSMSRRGGL